MTPKSIREHLVYDIFFQVCGTQGSGKTTLAQLLRQYIQKKEPKTQFIYFDHWPEDNPLRHWPDCLTASGWNRQDGSTIILDEGQTTIVTVNLDSGVSFKMFRTTRNSTRTGQLASLTTAAQLGPFQ